MVPVRDNVAGPFAKFSFPKAKVRPLVGGSDVEFNFLTPAVRVASGHTLNFLTPEFHPHTDRSGWAWKKK